jgi:hypothetical protein
MKLIKGIMELRLHSAEEMRLARTSPSKHNLVAARLKAFDEHCIRIGARCVWEILSAQRQLGYSILPFLG